MSASREMKTEIARDHYEVWKKTSVEAAWNSINHDTSQTKPLAAVDAGVDDGDMPAIFNPLILKGPFPILREPPVLQGDIVTPQQCVTAFMKKTNLKRGC